jgi:hypothetical protein
MAKIGVLYGPIVTTTKGVQMGWGVRFLGGYAQASKLCVARTRIKRELNSAFFTQFSFQVID